MDSTRTDVRTWGRLTATLVVMALAGGTALYSQVPATAARSAPHEPVGAFLRSSSLTSPQFCGSTQPTSRSLTPILGVSSGAPAHNTGRPNLKATFEVAQLSQAPLLSVTVAFNASLATYQVPVGALGEGSYRFRARAVDGNQASTWLPWCAFTVQTVNVPTPGVPNTLRISAGPYEGFQFCGATAPVISAQSGATFAASPPSYGSYPNLLGRFEIARPGREAVITVGNMNGVGVPAEAFTPGTYQFRVRAEEGDAVSAWSAWCDFVAA